MIYWGMTKISEDDDVKKWGIRRLSPLWIVIVSCKSWWEEQSVATREHGYDQKARLITKYSFSDLTITNIRYDGKTFILQIVNLKKTLTTRACYSAYYSADTSTDVLYSTFLESLHNNLPTFTFLDMIQKCHCYSRIQTDVLLRSPLLSAKQGKYICL